MVEVAIFASFLVGGAVWGENGHARTGQASKGGIFGLTVIACFGWLVV